MAIYLIRHGETASNASRVVQFPETPLSEHGLAQAARLGERLRGRPFARILVSDYARAHQTAEAVAATTGAPLEVHASLRERHLGDLRGRAYADLAAEGIEPFADGYHPPGGESWEQFHDRVDDAWDTVTASARALAAEQDLAVVTHGLVCSSIHARKLRTASENDFVLTGWTNTSVTVIEADAGEWVVTLLNCAAHLDDVHETGPA